MSKDFKLLLGITTTIFSIFFIIDCLSLKNYNIYEGKIIGFDNRSTTYSDGKQGNVKINWDIPKMEYYKNNDTIICEDGRLVLISSFGLNEKIRVLESKNDKFQVKIFSFFYYWINFQKIVIFGYYFVFIKKS
jgi:hypothetical protein